MGSTTSQKSVSWGMAYYSELGDVDIGAPIALPLPDAENESSSLNKTTKANRFCSQAIRGAQPKPYKRPSTSPEEFHMGLVIPRRKGLLVLENDEGDSCSVPNPPAIDEELFGSSEMFTETETE